MQFCAQNCGEISVPKGCGVRNRIVPDTHEMIGQGDEIITLRLVTAADLCRLQNAIRQGRMGVQVATVELARLREEVGHLRGPCRRNRW